MIFCKACGERYGGVDRDAPDDVRKLMATYCGDCASEIAGRTVPKYGTLQHDTGGGTRVIRSARGLA